MVRCDPRTWSAILPDRQLAVNHDEIIRSLRNHKRPIAVTAGLLSTQKAPTNSRQIQGLNLDSRRHSVTERAEVPGRPNKSNAMTIWLPSKSKKLLYPCLTLDLWSGSWVIASNKSPYTISYMSKKTNWVSIYHNLELFMKNTILSCMITLVQGCGSSHQIKPHT